MPHPRKRKRGVTRKVPLDDEPPVKKGRIGKKEKTGPESNQPRAPPQTQHPVLNQFYPQVLTLRNYVLSRLPITSRLRRKKVATVGIGNHIPDSPLSDVERSLGSLLDDTLVGVQTQLRDPEENCFEGWKAFSQKGDESHVTLSNGLTGFIETQALIVEYVVRTIFSKEKTSKWPKHLLCDGYSRNHGLGLRAFRPNPHVETLKQPPWPQLLALMGDSGEHIMITLLLDCAIFVPVKTGANNFCQISGK
ncbi:hypothetical protein K445DRAFT_245405 [Daldinia sp. EC12]|nr:hypothetical protein K445DRAFT_245405 [Daldinia sp. EC12]